MRTLKLIILIIAIVGLALPAGPVASEHGTSCEISNILAQDTVYHAIVDFAQSRVRVSYGHYALVDCYWRTDKSSVPQDLIADPDRGLSTVTGRRIWSGHAAVPDRVVRTVARTTSAAPEQVARVMPERFEIVLSGGILLRIMTERGRQRPLRFGEKWHRWLRAVCAACEPEVATMIVSTEDAQTLYYALEPGTPVIFAAGRK